MRAITLLASIGIVAVAFYLGSWTGLLIAVAVCVALVAGLFVLSTDKTESVESREMRKAMGRNTTFLAGLFETSKR
jgi:hypothetical protein